MPFSFKSIAEDSKNYTYGNSFVSLTVYLKLLANLESACAHAKSFMTSLKSSSMPGAMYTLLEFYGTFMP